MSGGRVRRSPTRPRSGPGKRGQPPSSVADTAFAPVANGSGRKLPLKTSELRYRRLFESARDGILILNAETGQIEDANPFMSELLGYPHGELIGKQLWEIGVFKDIDNSREAFRRLQLDGVIRYDDLPLKATNGTPHEVEFVSNIYDEDDRLVIQCNIREITDRKRLERESNDQKYKLAEASRLKSDFLAILSHELRNPLAAIRYALPPLEEASLDEAGRAAVAVIGRQLTQLVGLVDDLLDLTRITSGKIAVARELVAVQAVVKVAIESVSPVIGAGRHALTIVAPDEPIWVNADPSRIAQVVGNLVTNAAKYTPPDGTITLTLSRELDQAVISVADNGMGIAKDQLPHLFKMFMQVNPRENAQGGLGVGLTIAKRLVELHDGSIEAHSDGPGCGTKFAVRLPLASSTGRLPPAQRQLLTPPTVRQLKVLVVDDNFDLVQMLELCISEMGHDVRRALDGQSAITLALTYVPDVIFLDIGLPVVNGLEVARELRRHPEMARTRLIALTGWGQEQDHRRTLEAGFDDHLTKPTDPADLARILAEVAKDRV